ncbi:MAG: metallophosphoesterase [Myxococcota bacterium]|nr:metallophosphoesterase [Myxococcota bacterium]
MDTYAWLTDPHLDFLTTDALEVFAHTVGEEAVQGLFITGDIAEADSVIPCLKVLRNHIEFPIYFVLGTHDYYGAAIDDVSVRVDAWSQGVTGVHWMPSVGVVALSSTTALVGHGGWADGRVGNFLGSSIVLNDYRKITDLVGLTPRARLARLQSLGTQAATQLAPDLRAALTRYEEVIVLTHVPPFQEACWYQGRNDCNEWTPHFTCGAMGALLLRVAAEFSHRRIRVLCGHTHHGGVAEMAPNLTVITGAAEYGQPRLLKPIECM